MVEVEKLSIPPIYFDLLPTSLQEENKNTTLIQIKNSLLWLFYLYDLQKDKRDRVIKELLKIDYMTQLNLHPEFDPLAFFLYFQERCKELILSIKKNLKRIDKYEIKHPGLIIASIYSAWPQPGILTENEYKLLREIVKNPAGSFREWSKNAGISLAGVKYSFDRLKKKVMLRIWSQINFTSIKLRNYLVMFSGIQNEDEVEFLKEKCLRNIWCTTVFSFASHPNSLFVSITIPSHTRCINTFLNSMKTFQELENVIVYEKNETFLSYNFTSYDPKTGWNFSPLTWIMFSLSDASKDYMEYLKKINTMHRIPYENAHHLNFSKKDLYIIAALSRDFRIKTTALSEISGYPLPTVSKKKKDFVKKKIIYPLPCIANIGLSSSISLLWEISNKDVEYILHALSELPYVIGYRMREIYPSKRNYLMTFLFLPGTVSSRLIKNLREIGEHYGLKELFYERKGPGSFTIDRFINRWDEKRQNWLWYESDFEFL